MQHEWFAKVCRKRCIVLSVHFCSWTYVLCSVRVARAQLIVAFDSVP